MSLNDMISEVERNIRIHFKPVGGRDLLLISLHRMVKFNQSNHLPYHNSTHALRLTLTLLDAFGDNSDLIQNTTLPEHKINGVFANLLLAAIFHDFDHLGKPDSIDHPEVTWGYQLSEQLPNYIGVPNNIFNALYGFRKYVGNYALAQLFIASTAYPYVDEKELMSSFGYALPPHPLYNLVLYCIGLIRDCDRINFLEVNWVNTWIFGGIVLEMGIVDKTDLEIQQNYMNWVTQEKWYTAWGQSTYDRYTTPVYGKMTSLIEDDFAATIKAREGIRIFRDSLGGWL